MNVEENSKKNPTLICTFVNKSKIIAFVNFVKNKLHIKNVHVYSIETNKDEFIVLFNTFRKLRFTGFLKYSRTIHFKNGSIFSINAINELIKQINGDDVDTSKIELDWGKYSNKLIVLANGELKIDNIEPVNSIEITF